MDPIPVPKPKSIWNPDRLASSLVLAQLQHLHEAQRSLPPKYHSDVFIKTIKTEGQAADYIREVTEAIHAAHQDGLAKRKRTTRAPKKKTPASGSRLAPKKASRAKGKARSKTRK